MSDIEEIDSILGDIKETQDMNNSPVQVQPEHPKAAPVDNFQEVRTADQNAQVDNDIDLSMLEVLANQKKLKKESIEIEINKIDSEKSSSKRSKKKNLKSSSSASSSSSSSNYISSDSSYKAKKRSSSSKKENEDPNIRREKSEYLYKLSKLNADGKWSSLELTMNHSLDEIRNEFERVKNAIQSENSVRFLKKTLLLGIQGIEMLNNRFDPLGVDLNGWGDSMAFSLSDRNQEYDEVLAELYEKYKGAGQMSPEVR